MGGGGFSQEREDRLLDDLVLGLAREVRGRDRPHVCFIGTASGDNHEYLATFYASYARRTEATHLGLFGRTVDDIEALLLDQDLIHVGGGNTANMLAIWRVHGVDRALRAAWDAGVVLAGVSAGANCWFQGSTTDSFGGLAALADGLAFLPGSFSPHYDGEARRRPVYRQLVGSGQLPGGYAADDHTAFVFHGADLAEVVAGRPEARGYRVARGPAGDPVETELPTRYLG
ncbi:MAG: peptidase E [Chloroflexi bacterium]|nr:peptidase E [Chloroflexota bacterium]